MSGALWETPRAATSQRVSQWNVAFLSCPHPLLVVVPVLVLVMSSSFPLPRPFLALVVSSYSSSSHQRVSQWNVALLSYPRPLLVLVVFSSLSFPCPLLVSSSLTYTDTDRH